MTTISFTTHEHICTTQRVYTTHEHLCTTQTVYHPWTYMYYSDCIPPMNIYVLLRLYTTHEQYVYYSETAYHLLTSVYYSETAYHLLTSVYYSESVYHPWTCVYYSESVYHPWTCVLLRECIPPMNICVLLRDCTPPLNICVLLRECLDLTYKTETKYAPTQCLGDNHRKHPNHGTRISTSSFPNKTKITIFIVSLIPLIYRNTYPCHTSEHDSVPNTLSCLEFRPITSHRDIWMLRM